MADRHIPPSARVLASGISKTRGVTREKDRDRDREMHTTNSSSTTTATTTTATANSVRRNLFQNQLTRRPTAGSATSEETVRLDNYPHQHQQQQQQQQQHSHRISPDLTTPSAFDIVVRDKNGEIELGDPPTPPIDDPDELEALSEQLEAEREKQRLADAVRQHQIDRTSVPMQHEGKAMLNFIKLPPLRPPKEGYNTANNKLMFATTTELLEAVKQSLRAKVAALAEDNWMFEPEEISRHQI